MDMSLGNNREKVKIMKKMFLFKVLFFTVMIASFILLNIILDVWGFIFIGFALGFLVNAILKKNGYVIKKTDSLKHWESSLWPCIFLLIIMISLPANHISIFILEWISYLFLVGFFFWAEITCWKSGYRL